MSDQPATSALLALRAPAFDVATSHAMLANGPSSGNWVRIAIAFETGSRFNEFAE